MPIKFNLNHYKTRTYIETGLGEVGAPGSGHPNSVRQALNEEFETVHSIEISQPLYADGVTRFQKDIESKKLFLHLGDSLTILPKILKKIDWRCTFFLDSHGGYGGGSGVGTKKCPIIEELDIIKNHPINDHVLLIDDLRILNADAFGTPGISEEIIKEKILEINPAYSFSYENGHTINDVLAAIIP